MNLLSNKNPKGGEYILKTKPDTYNFHYTEKQKYSLGILIKIALFFWE